MRDSFPYEVCRFPYLAQTAIFPYCVGNEQTLREIADHFTEDELTIIVKGRPLP